MSISLNGFKVKLSAKTFTAYVQDMPDNTKLQALREKLQDSWFLHWREGKVYGIPNIPEPEQTFGESVELKCDEHLQLLASRIANVLPAIFSMYSPFRLKPFTFLAQKDELVSSIAANLKGLPLLISAFKIKPKLTRDAKLVELRHEETFVGLVLRVETRWEIFASLSALQNAGVNLQGLYVVRRQPPQNRR